MQKLLSTQQFALYPPLRRILTNVKARLSTGLILLLLVSIAHQVNASSVNPPSTVVFTPVRNGVTGPAQNYSTANAPRSGYVADLGTFDRGTGHLYLSGIINTTETGNENFTSVGISYRVYQTTSSASGNSSFLGLGTKSDAKSKDKVWDQPATTVDLLSSTSAGTYVVQFYFQGTFTSKPNPTTQRIDNSGVLYTAQFTVTGSVPSRWITTTGDNSWFNSANWSGGMPGPQTDVTIPYSDDPNATYPIIDVDQPAYARTLTIETKANLTQYYGELFIYGDFKDANGGFRQSQGTLVLAGPTSQSFDGGIFTNVRIQGGSNKSLNVGQRMVVTNLLQFVNGKIITPPGSSTATTGIVDLSSGGRVEGESESSYVEGVLQASIASRNLTVGSINTFGNVGVDLTLNSNLGTTQPSSVIITRRIGPAYAGVGISTNKESITRSYTFNFNDNGNQNFGLTFHYLNRELNGNTASKLGIYSYTVADGSSTNYGSDYTDVSLKTVTANNITGRLATTFTLAESVNPAPLPVDLVSFNAIPTIQGAALLRWVTAKELNNKGFGIERTLDPTGTWKEVGYVATTNTPNGKSYEYTDKSLITAAASTNAYYRLRQEDLDGKISYSPVAAVARQAALASTGIVLSPVPLDGPNLSVSFAEAGQAGQEVAIINTQGQRMLHFTTQENAEGTLSLPVANLAAGVYIVRIQTPGQAVRHARFVKL
jgi:hypothetical protein